MKERASTDIVPSRGSGWTSIENVTEQRSEILEKHVLGIRYFQERGMIRGGEVTTLTDKWLRWSETFINGRLHSRITWPLWEGSCKFHVHDETDVDAIDRLIDAKEG